MHTHTHANAHAHAHAHSRTHMHTRTAHTCTHTRTLHTPMCTRRHRRARARTRTNRHLHLRLAARTCAQVCRRRGVWLHVDACLGGFVLPFARKLGRDVPAFDFSVPGVTSMSADTHKFGLADKGTSVVLYASSEHRMLQYTSITDWSGGLYISPTMVRAFRVCPCPCLHAHTSLCACVRVCMCMRALCGPAQHRHTCTSPLPWCRNPRQARMCVERCGVVLTRTVFDELCMTEANHAHICACIVSWNWCMPTGAPVHVPLRQAGSRPGALIATAWAAMVRMGEDGYLDSTQRLMAAVDRCACMAVGAGSCLAPLASRSKASAGTFSHAVGWTLCSLPLHTLRRPAWTSGMVYHTLAQAPAWKRRSGRALLTLWATARCLGACLAGRARRVTSTAVIMHVTRDHGQARDEHGSDRAQ